MGLGLVRRWVAFLDVLSEYTAMSAIECGGGSVAWW